MENLSGFACVDIEFDKEGRVWNPAQVEQLRQVVAGGSYTDLLVVAHGWNNDMAEARELVARLVQSLSTVAALVPGGPVPAQTLVLRVLWPSKKYADADLIPSGAASVGDDLDRIAVEANLDQLAELFDDARSQERIAQARALVPDLEADEAARRQFADLVRSVLPRGAADDEDASRSFFDQPGDQLMSRLAGASEDDSLDPDTAAGDGPVLLDLSSGPMTGDEVEGGGDAGQAAGLADLWRGAVAGARALLNFTTYYEMKRRAGQVGEGLATQVLRPLLVDHGTLRVHLVGHSFGGRLVTSAALALGTAGSDAGAAARACSVSLLQAAFSHYGFAQHFDGDRNGAFRSVVASRLVSGPIVATYTKNDIAVGRAYPIASRIAGQDSSELGDENDRFGGMGRNGAQLTPEATRVTMLPAGGTYPLEGVVTNVLADDFVKGHSDVTGPEVAYLVACAMAGAQPTSEPAGQPSP